MDFCTPIPWDPAIGNLFMNAMANLDAQTDAYDSYSSTCGPNTDLGGYLDESPEKVLVAGERGWTLCTKRLAYSSTVCDQFSLILHSDFAVSSAQRSKTLCHEIGHAVGLRHVENGIPGWGCMEQGAVLSTSYVAHHVSHVNSYL